MIQDGATAAWDPPPNPSPDIVLLALGNVPAAFVSWTVRPGASIPSRQHPWDPAWFLIHEAVCFPIWFLAGLGIDSGRVHARNIMLGYLAVRAVFALLALRSGGLARGGGKLEFLFWFAFAMWLIAWCIIRAVARLRPV